MRRTRTALAAVCLACSSLSLVGAQPGHNATAQSLITDPTEECTYYNIAPFDSFYGLFPKVWTIATIQPNDTVAQALFDKISPGIPDIPQFGSPDYSNDGVVNYTKDYPDDPFCPKYPGIPPELVSCPGVPDTWGLGFDDGPNCSHNAFYDYLWANNQKADVYYIGSSCAIWPLQCQRGLNDGHIIGDHTWSHRAMSALSNEQVFAELYYSLLMIKSVTGVQPTSFRAPFGSCDDRVRWIALQLGLRTVIWNQNTYDYSSSSLGTPVIMNNYQAVIQNRAKGNVNVNGTVVLTHELTNQTMSIFVDEYPNIKGNFSNVEPAHVCNNISHPYVETQYSYPVHSQWASGTRALANYTATASLVTTLAMVSSTGSIKTVSDRSYSDAAATNPTAVAGVVVTNTGSASPTAARRS